MIWGKLKFYCENVVKFVLPAFRSLVAKKLIEDNGFTQVSAAEKLGITQAAISQYLYSKRGVKKIKEIEAMPQVQKFVDKYIESLVDEKSPSIDDMPMFCELCHYLKKTGYGNFTSEK